MTPLKAIQTMRLGARAAIGPARAEEIANAFGRSLRDLGIRPRPIETIHRANQGEGDSHAPVVAMAQLACALAGITMELPYYNTLSNLTYNVGRAARVLAGQSRRPGAKLMREPVLPTPAPEATLNDRSHVALAERSARRAKAAGIVDTNAA